MDGLYLYAVRENSDGSAAISIKGVDEKSEVFVIRHRGLEAVVSNVYLDEFGSEQIQRKAREDLNWIKEKSVAHESVIEKAMIGNGRVIAVLPMRFGIIFKDRNALENSLNENYPRITKLLEKVRGNQEWSVKIYLEDRKKLEEVARAQSDTIRQKEKEIAALPEGMAFFIEEELRQTIAEEVEKKLNTTMDVFFEGLKKQSVDSVKNKVLGRELTGKCEPMILNAAYLVAEEKVENFKKGIEDLKHEMHAKGLCLEYSGPWPAFNFTSY